MPDKNPPLPQLIVGLGNPGAQYEHTRHNTGVDFLRQLCGKYGIELRSEPRFFGETGRGSIEGHDVRVLFPTTFMNESGRAVQALCAFFKLQSREILVVPDDLDLLPGHMKLRFGGGFAGHNGLKSISACLGGTQDFLRLRIGIGMPPSHDVISWVLGRAFGGDHDDIDEAMQCALKALGVMYKQGIARAVNIINGFKPQVQNA